MDASTLCARESSAPRVLTSPRQANAAIQSRDMSGRAVGFLLALWFCAGVAFGGCSGGSDDSSPSASPSPETHTITGTFTVQGKSCYAVSDSGYSDIPGTQLRVKDEGGTVIAYGNVEASGKSPSDIYGCVYDLKIPSVPNAKIYTITSGRR